MIFTLNEHWIRIKYFKLEFLPSYFRCTSISSKRNTRYFVQSLLSTVTFNDDGECESPFVIVELVLLEFDVSSSLLLLFAAIIDPKPDRGKSLIIDFLELVSALCNVSGGKLNAGNEKPAAAAACNDCNSAAECSWALRRNSATDVVRGSLTDDADGMVFAIDVARFPLIDAVDDVIVGQHEHRPGNPGESEIKFDFKCLNQNYIRFLYWWLIGFNGESIIIDSDTLFFFIILARDWKFDFE